MFLQNMFWYFLVAIYLKQNVLNVGENSIFHSQNQEHLGGIQNRTTFELFRLDFDQLFQFCICYLLNNVQFFIEVSVKSMEMCIRSILLNADFFCWFWIVIPVWKIQSNTGKSCLLSILLSFSNSIVNILLGWIEFCNYKMMIGIFWNLWHFYFCIAAVLDKNEYFLLLILVLRQ